MVWLNGEPRPLEGKTLKEVLEEMGVELKGVAVLLNEEAFLGLEVPDRPLRDGDVVEVVALMQGQGRAVLPTAQARMPNSTNRVGWQ